MNTNAQYPHPSEDDGIEAFLAHRRRLFGIAYRVLGSSFEAEDVVQETWIRWQLCDRTTVRDPGAFLATTTTRLAINVLTSAHSRRETYLGPWLPEPVDTSHDPTLGAENGEALEYAVLLLMERLTPMERAAYVLREAFTYPYSRIAEILQSTEVRARQLVCRARRHLASGTTRAVSRGDQRRVFLSRFLDAARGRDASALEKLLAGGDADQSRSIQSRTRFSVLDSARDQGSRTTRRIAG
ncbi:MAG: sigma-70 family RNA polymerase sigma factor [Microbacterium sp.]